MWHLRNGVLKFFLLMVGSLSAFNGQGWGFYAHKSINYHAVFLLPPGMIGFYKRHVSFLADHAVDPDKRRYALKEEGPRHYIDLDSYAVPVRDSMPTRWDDALVRFGPDSLHRHGIAPWWIERMRLRLTRAFRERDAGQILKLSADLGHYISDAHVPLHASRNHNGQLTGQHGIHGFWESRIPERFAATSFDFIIGRAIYLERPSDFIWARVWESAAAADTVLTLEKKLSEQFPADARFAYEQRNGIVIRQYSTAYTDRYHRLLQGMVERRMRASILAVASYWYTAWVDAGQPTLDALTGNVFSAEDSTTWDTLEMRWRADAALGRICD
jgi:hypothetical protein